MKAFDTVNWKFLNKCLEYFKFGETFKRWISILQTNITSCVINTGFSSGFFKLGRGVRQGCPISPYLFLICSEILGIGIRESIEIKGIKINNSTYKISQFADDTQVLLDGSQESLNAAMLLLKDFETISGMKVNFDKSEVARIGSAKNNVYNFINQVKVTDTFLNVLGVKIPINGNCSDTIALNYNPLLQKVNAILSRWKLRKLTLYGKGVIIKSLILPQVIYQMTNLVSPPDTFLHTLDNKITDFLWDGKPAKINRKQMYLNYNEGGLKIPNFFVYSKSLKLKWIKLLADVNFQSDWKDLFQSKSNTCNVFLTSNIQKSEIKKLGIKSKFWNETLEIWAQIHSKFDEELSCMSLHPQIFLWFNNKIKVNNKVVFYKEWHLKGINYVKHLIKEDGTYFTFNEFKEYYHIQTNF